jgi:hypothetical protein
MNKRYSLLVLAWLVIAAAAPAWANKNPVQTCTARFAFVSVDRLGNVYRELAPGNEPKEIQKKMAEAQKKLNKYGDVCYTADETGADYVFFVHTTPAVYHGVRTTSNTSTDTESNPVNGTITDQSGNTSTIRGTVDTTTRTTTTSSVPYEVDYSVFTLNILIPHLAAGSTDWTYTTLHTFEQKGLYTTFYGIGFGKGKNPIVNVIDAAAEWLHEYVQQRMATVNILVTKVHELSVAGQLPESDEPPCAQKIAEQFRANGEMLARLERRDFSDVERLFGQFCEPPNNQK